MALSQGGFDVIEACDGLDGVEKLAANSDVSAIICDVNMPGMGGLEFLEKIRAEGCELPVVMLTTEGQPEPIARAKKAGAQGWIVKPFKAKLLISAVTKLTATAA